MVASKSWQPWLAVAVIIVCGVIGISFFVETAALGGDALNGYVNGGHYFVSSHGSDTEVSQGLWTLSRIHGVAMMISVPLGMFAMAFLLFRYVLPFLMTGSTPGRSDVRVAAIRASGMPLWSGAPGGVAGGVYSTVGMLAVEVYPGGIVVKPRFMTPFAVPVDEIRSVRLGRSRFTSTVEIEHSGRALTSPLVIYGAPNSPQAVALTALGERHTNGAPAGSATDPGRFVLPVAAWPPPEIARRTAPGPMRALSILGLIVAAGMVIAGLLVVVPRFGPFGFVWTAVALVILISNARRFIRHGW